jgi:superfamily I DNA and/or RNA helicase
VIILSCVRSGSKRTLGFLKNRNRLNVAISRARECMYIVGHLSALLRYGNAAWCEILNHGNVLHIN